MAIMEYGKLVESIYSAFTRQDTRYILDQLAEDVEWVVFGPSSIPFAGTWYGRENVGRFFATIRSTQKTSRIAVTEIIATGKTVVATIRYSGIVAATGRRFDTSAVHVFTFQGGRVTSFRDYFDTAQMEAAYSSTAQFVAA
jgi:ketosteroid isomerase-like protein